MKQALEKANNGLTASVCLLAFAALCWYAWPYRDNPDFGKPVELHSFKLSNPKDSGQVVTLDMLMGTAEVFEAGRK